MVMRQVMVMVILLFGLTTSYSLAQMGHGMMRDSHMMEEHGMTGSGQMMEHGKMMGNIKGMTQDISDLMRKMSELMGSDISRERAHAMSNVVRDMAVEMNRISFMIDRGSATEEEMIDVQNRMMEIKKYMSNINK
jgi:hypothetical protein